MFFKKEIFPGIAAIFLISLGGLLLHVRIHPVAKDAFNWLPVIATLAGVLALPVMFNYKSTVAWAYLINLIIVIVGIVAMSYYSITNWDIDKTPVTFVNIMLYSTMPDNLILAAKVPIAHMILRHFRPR